MRHFEQIWRPEKKMMLLLVSGVDDCVLLQVNLRALLRIRCLDQRWMCRESIFVDHSNFWTRVESPSYHSKSPTEEEEETGASTRTWKGKQTADRSAFRLHGWSKHSSSDLTTCQLKQLHKLKRKIQMRSKSISQHVPQAIPSFARETEAVLEQSWLMLEYSKWSKTPIELLKNGSKPKGKSKIWTAAIDKAAHWNNRSILCLSPAFVSMQ